MANVTFFASTSQFESEFQRCCKQYDNLDMYIAWIGDPKNVIPFEYIHLLKSINAVVGISFCQSHPDGIKLLMDLTTDLRIAKENILYHPKVYIFSSKNKKEVFIGSSNFTYQGFYKNNEANVLIGGSANDKEIKSLEHDLQKWKSKEHSIKPDEQWLAKYTERYNKRRRKIKEAGLDDETEKEEETSSSSAWLAVAAWDIYMKKVLKGLRNHTTRYEESLKWKLDLFKIFNKELPLPFKVEYFKDLEKRKLIGGMNPYGWLGHVAASGDFRRMLKNGTSIEHKTIAASVNSIASLSYPLDYKKLNRILDSLVELGPTMKVWGRLLALVRPDLFCTISAPTVRRNISNLLDTSEKHFEGVEGYLMLIRLIHASPWFNSKIPTDKTEIEIWKKRVAFLDVVFYD